MSMLSAQVDELRQMAESVGLAMPQVATLMMEAADTIERLESENAKLREYVTKLEQENIVLSSNNCDLLNDMAPMQEWNAKLRELCEWLLNPYRLGAVTGEGVDKQWCRETYDGGSYRLHELGGEVEK